MFIIRKLRFYLLKVLLIVLSIALISSSTAAFASSTDGWVYVGYPQYTKASGTINQKPDIAGTTVMTRLRNSYSYNYRMPKIATSTWKQNYFYINSKDYSDITYYNSPYGPGYTAWYDSPYGQFLDYEDGFVEGLNNDPSPPVSITQDSIEFNNVQFPGGSNSAYVATEANWSQLADAKTASIVGENSNLYYPIFLNNGLTLENSVTSAANNMGVKNLILLGGSGCFNPTAGLTSGFNIIRAGGIDREFTKTYLQNLPSQINSPGHYLGDSNGVVIQGLSTSDPHYNNVYNFLNQEASQKNVSNLINAATYLMNTINIGSEPNSGSSPAIILGVHNPYYEIYWICYLSTTSGTYVYQYVLPNYYNRNAGLQFLDSNKNPVSSLTLNKGTTYNGYVRAFNKGNITWNELTQYRLGTDSTTFPGQPGRLYLLPGLNILSGQYFDFPVTLNASTIGNSNLHYQMLQEGITWFGDTLDVPVTVIAPNLTIQSMNVVNSTDDTIQSKLIIGRQYRVRTIVVNNGNAIASSNELAVWNYSWNPLSVVRCPSLNPGQSYTLYSNFTPTSAGIMNYTSCTDHLNEVIESNEADNWSSGNINVYNIPTALFTVQPNPQIVNYPLSYNDYSSSNNSGDNLIKREWSYSSDGGISWSYPVSTPPGNFSSPGNYKIRLRVQDQLLNMWSSYYVQDLTIIDVNIIGQVNHTDLWNQHRIEFNRANSGTDDNPRSYDVFWPGEDFVLNATTSSQAQNVHAALEGTSFETDLVDQGNNKWSGSLWDQSMCNWKSQPLKFLFTATYPNGVTRTNEVQIYIENTPFWQQHREF